MDGIERFVSAERIAERIARLAEIGGLPNGGMQRLPFSAEDKVARDLFAQWAAGARLTVRVDGAGNVIGRREGTDPAAPVVMSGSHLDTQASGGRFDGIAGVIAALEAAEAMQTAGFRHRHPLEFVDFACEEAVTRFDFSMPGSRGMIGALTEEDMAKRCRLTGLTAREVMESIGIDAARFREAERAPGSIKAVVELHIEQGPYLELAGKQVGVVTHVAGSTRFHCTLRGQQAHSGGMPIEFRRDALCGAAEIIVAVETVAKAFKEHRLVATVGYLEYEPRAIAIVPGYAHLILDVRCTDPAAMERAVAEIRRRAEEIAARRKLDVAWGEPWFQYARDFTPELVTEIEQACRDLDVPHQRLFSGGGHDAMTMGRRFPAAMIFVPSVNGISHAPEELTHNEDIVAGARVLCRTLCRLAA